MAKEKPVIYIQIKTDLKKFPKRCQNCPFYGHQNNYGWAGSPCCTAMWDRKVKPKEKPEWCPLVMEMTIQSGTTT